MASDFVYYVCIFCILRLHISILCSVTWERGLRSPDFLRVYCFGYTHGKLYIGRENNVLKLYCTVLLLTSKWKYIVMCFKYKLLILLIYF
jgi:hypothetical protein